MSLFSSINATLTLAQDTCILIMTAVSGVIRIVHTIHKSIFCSSASNITEVDRTTSLTITCIWICCGICGLELENFISLFCFRISSRRCLIIMGWARVSSTPILCLFVFVIIHSYTQFISWISAIVHDPSFKVKFNLWLSQPLSSSHEWKVSSEDPHHLHFPYKSLLHWRYMVW